MSDERLAEIREWAQGSGSYMHGMPGMRADAEDAKYARLMVRDLLARLDAVTKERDELGNKLVQEQAKPGGSFDQWALLQAAEADAEALAQALGVIAHGGYGDASIKARAALDARGKP